MSRNCKTMFDLPAEILCMFWGFMGPADLLMLCWTCRPIRRSVRSDRGTICPYVSVVSCIERSDKHVLKYLIDTWHSIGWTYSAKTQKHISVAIGKYGTQDILRLLGGFPLRAHIIGDQAAENNNYRMLSYAIGCLDINNDNNLKIDMWDIQIMKYVMKKDDISRLRLLYHLGYIDTESNDHCNAFAFESYAKYMSLRTWKFFVEELKMEIQVDNIDLSNVDEETVIYIMDHLPKEKKEKIKLNTHNDTTRNNLRT